MASQGLWHQLIPWESLEGAWSTLGSPLSILPWPLQPPRVMLHHWCQQNGKALVRGWQAWIEEGERGCVPVSTFKQGNLVLFVTLVGELFL